MKVSEFFIGEVFTFFRETTIHGFNHIGNQNHYIARTFWALIIVVGFTWTFLLYQTNTADWEENPFMTTIETRDLIGSGIPFPTVTVCPELFAKPDRWALIRKIADRVKFECYEDEDEYPPCNETTQSRSHPATKEIFRQLEMKMGELFDAVSVDDVELDEESKGHIKDLLGVTKSKAISLAIDNLGKKRSPYRIGQSAKDGEELNITANSNYSAAEVTYKKLRKLFTKDGFMPFGTFLETFSHLLENSTSLSDRETSSFNCSSLRAEEKALHGFFSSLSKSLGIGGDHVSLFELPIMLVNQPHISRRLFFPYTACQGEASNRSFDFVSETYNWILAEEMEHESPGTHPCDGIRPSRLWDCGFWSDKMGGYGNLATIVRIMKVAFHLGQWDNYRVQTEEFQTRENKTSPDQDSRDYFVKEDPDYLGENIISWSKLHGEDNFEISSNFQPVFTDQGICTSANSLKVKEMLKDGHTYGPIFEEAFKEELENKTFPFKNIMRSGIYESLIAYVDRHSFLRSNGKAIPLEMLLSSTGEQFDFRSRKLPIRKGFNVMIRVDSVQEFSVSESVYSMPIGTRNCRLPHETDGLEIFGVYTKSGCKYECMIRQGAEACRCVPWNYPSPIGNVSRVCDLFGTVCFEGIMQAQALLARCKHCLNDCTSTSYGYTIHESPIRHETKCEFMTDIAYLTYAKRGKYYPEFLRNLNNLQGRPGMTFEGEKWWREMCLRHGKEDISIIRVMVTTGTYTRIIKSQKATFGDKIGNLGGTLGLFTGMSVISLIEAFYWAAKVFVKYLRGLKAVEPEDEANGKEVSLLKNEIAAALEQVKREQKEIIEKILRNEIEKRLAGDKNASS